VSANASVSLDVAASSPRMRHSGRRKNGHTPERDARTECSEIKTLARVAVGRSSERFGHTRASPFLDIVLERQYSGVVIHATRSVPRLLSARLVGFSPPRSRRVLIV
jgi:hypothetical protein